MSERMEKVIPGIARLVQIEQIIRSSKKVLDSRLLTAGLKPNEVLDVKADAGLRRIRVW
ncbi:MAG: hypothetical protein AAB414_01320 [Patescibacteria group bacterium]